jgi:aldehyde dehydrogenase (NAD+)
VDYELHNQEIFGPISAVRCFKTEEVMAVSNETNFGLMAGVFTQDMNRALRAASEFESGTVGVNCMSLIFFTAIWWKQGERSGEKMWYQRIESLH